MNHEGIFLRYQSAINRTIRFIIIALLVCFCALPINALASGFSSDSAAMNKAAESVLMLEVYNSKGNCIATGSGFVAFNSSTLITNYHVIEDGSYIIANTDDGKQYRISDVLCANEGYDIAVLFFGRDTGMQPLTLYCGDDVQRGDSVVAIGSPEGLKNTISTGIISSAYVEDDEPWLQITAPISHGSSGGALFDDNGNVIGITSAGYIEGQNLNFAIKADVAQAIYNCWDGNKYTLQRAPKHSKVDLSTVDTKAAKTTYNTVADDAKWTCPNCANVNVTKFCLQCGKARPQWRCCCGTECITPFCGNCGGSVEQQIARFNTAEGFRTAGDYEQAVSIFIELGSFNSETYETSCGINTEPASLISECFYEWATDLFADGDYYSAIECYQNAGTAYKDSSDKVKESFYLIADNMLAKGEYDLAIKQFENAKGYSDTETRIKEAHYLKAESLYNNGDYDKAADEYNIVKGFKDSLQRKNESYCLSGDKYLENGNYIKAREEYAKCDSSYSAAEEKILQAYYLEAVDCLDKEEYDNASKAFKSAGSYGDASARILEPYYVQGKKLMENGEYKLAVNALNKCMKYADTGVLLCESYYCMGIIALETDHDFDVAIDMFTKASGYSDAQQKITESQYAKAVSLGEKREYVSAISILKKLPSEMASEKIKEYSYYQSKILSGKTKSEREKNEREYLNYLIAADDYKDARELLEAAYTSGVAKRIAKGDYSDAYTMLKDAWKNGVSIEENIIAAEGKEDKDALKVVRLAKDMGFISWIPNDETVYQTKYVDGVKRMEAQFGLEADGIVYLSEMVVLDGVIYQGCSGENVRLLLERLKDLGYVGFNMPDSHDKYIGDYSYSIRKAETALGLTVDGFVTSDEYEVILAQKVTKPESVKNINSTQNNGIVNLSWNSTNGALWYEITRNGESIATTKNTYYRDETPKMGANNRYCIIAHNYSEESSKVFSYVSVYVDIVYKTVEVSKLVTNYSDYIGCYVRINGLTSNKYSYDGDNVYLVSKGGNSYIYVLMEDYESWDFHGEQGFMGYYLKGRINNFSIEGIVSGKKKSGLTSYPVITAYNINYNYN